MYHPIDWDTLPLAFDLSIDFNDSESVEFSFSSKDRPCRDFNVPSVLFELFPESADFDVVWASARGGISSDTVYVRIKNIEIYVNTV